MTIKVKWNNPNEGELPTQYSKYYVINKNNEHKIMSYNPNDSDNWYGDWGQHSNKKTSEIKCWTDLLCDGSF